MNSQVYDENRSNLTNKIWTNGANRSINKSTKKGKNKQMEQIRKITALKGRSPVTFLDCIFTRIYEISREPSDLFDRTINFATVP